MDNVIDFYINRGREKGREETRREYEAILADRDRLIAEDRRAMADKDRLIAEDRRAMADKDRAMAEMAKELEALKRRYGIA